MLTETVTGVKRTGPAHASTAAWPPAPTTGMKTAAGCGAGAGWARSMSSWLRLGFGLALGFGLLLGFGLCLRPVLRLRLVLCRGGLLVRPEVRTLCHGEDGLDAGAAPVFLLVHPDGA